MGCFLKSPFRVLLLFAWAFVSAVSFVHCAEEAPDVEYLNPTVGGSPSSARSVKALQGHQEVSSISPQVVIVDDKNPPKGAKDLYKEKPYLQHFTLSGGPQDGWKGAQKVELEAIARAVSKDSDVQDQFKRDVKEGRTGGAYEWHREPLETQSMSTNQATEGEENPEDVYPVVFVHGWTSKPADMQPMIDKIPWDREQPVAELYANDATNLTKVYSRHTVWNVGYYKNSVALEGQYEYAGRISHVPIAECPPEIQQLPTCKILRDYNSRGAYNQKLEIIVDNILRVTGAPKVNIIAHSMGGLVARAFIQLLDGHTKVHKLLMVGTPNHGSDESELLAAFCNTAMPDWMDSGEISEMISRYDGDTFEGYIWGATGCNYQLIRNAWEGTSFTNFLNADDKPWGNVRYATIAGTYSYCFPQYQQYCAVAEHQIPDDGLVWKESVALEGAEFNADYAGSHGNYNGAELSITESTYTAESIIHWFEADYLAREPIFASSCGQAICYRNQGDSDLVLTYNLIGGDAVALQVTTFCWTGCHPQTIGYVMATGEHDLSLPIADHQSYVWISFSIYDQYGSVTSQIETIKPDQCCSDGNPSPMPKTVITSKPSYRSAKSNAVIEFYPDTEEASESRWRINQGPWTEWTTDRSMTLTDPQPGFQMVEIASRLSSSDWMDQNITTVSWFQYDPVVDPASNLIARDAKYDQGGRLALEWEKSAEDESNVVAYEIMYYDPEEKSYGSIGALGAGTDLVIDHVDLASAYHYYIIRTWSFTAGYEDSDPAYSPPPEDNVPSELVLTRIEKESFRFELIDTTPLTDYIVEIFHHTDTDYKQASIQVLTDELGHAEGTLYSRDYVSGDSYTYATAREEVSSPDTTYTSNFIYNSRQVVEAFTLDFLPASVTIPTLTVSGTKNPNTSVWLDGEELIPLDNETIWSAEITLDPGMSDLVFKSKNTNGEVNGLGLAQVAYQSGDVRVEDTRYDNGDGLTITWQTEILGVTRYEVHRIRISDGAKMWIGKRPADVYSLVDRSADPSEEYTYLILAYTSDGTYEMIVPDTPAISPVDNIPRQILLARKGENTFSFELIDAEPMATYTIESFHHTDTDYGQSSIDVMTDRDGYASGEISSNDYSMSGRNYYVFAEATCAGETLTSNRIYNSRQVNSEFSLSPFPGSTRESILTLSGTKNADTSLAVNGEEIAPFSADTTWSVAVTLEEGKNTFVFTTKNTEGEVNGHGVASTFYVTGPEEGPTVNPVLSPTTIPTQVLSGTKPANTSLWINGVRSIASNEATTWESTVSLSEGWNFFTIDVRDEWDRPSTPLDIDIFLDAGIPMTPIIDPFEDPVNETWIVLYGSKEANTSIWVNSAEAMALNADTRFAVYLELPIEGENVFSVSAKDAVGNESEAVQVVVHRDMTASGEVLNFSAIWNGEAVELSWQNPDDPDFDHVSLGKMLENPRALYIWDTNNAVTDLVNDTGTSRDDLFTFLDAPHDLIEKPIRTLYFAAVTDTVNHIRDNAANLRSLITEATTHGVRVVYLDGDPTWATTNADIAQTRLDDMIAFNTSGNDNERFIGVQFDVEPYLLSGWYNDEIWEGYLGFLGRSQETVEASGQDIFFSVDIPFWYDDGVSGHPNLHEDVLDIVDEVIIMDYRDSAWGSGHGGAIQLSETELAYAQTVGKSVTLAFETQDIDPDYITFFEEGVSRMEDELAWVFDAVKSSSAFHELAVHYYTPYRNLGWENSSPLVWDVLGSEGDGVDDAAEKVVGIVSSNTSYYVESIVHVLPKISLTVQSLNIGIDSVEGDDPQLPVDVYIGKTVSATQVSDPILVKAGWIPEWHGSWQSLILDIPYSMQAGQSYGVWFKTRKIDGTSGNHYLRISADDSSTTETRIATRTDKWYTRSAYGAIQCVEPNPETYTHTPLDRWFVEIYKGTDESFVDTAVSPPQTLIYRIYAVDTAGNASDGEVATVKAE